MFSRIPGQHARPGAGVPGIGCEPAFATGQRPLLIKAAGGNILWDCQAYLDDESARRYLAFTRG